MAKCNRNCDICLFEECIRDDIDELDLYKAHIRDKEIADQTGDQTGDTSTKYYRYNHSYKRKLCDKRYLASEKGKETHKKSWQNYAKNHPDRVRAKSRLYYERHKDEIKARRLAKQKEKVGGLL